MINLFTFAKESASVAPGVPGSRDESGRRSNPDPAEIRPGKADPPTPGKPTGFHGTA